MKKIISINIKNREDYVSKFNDNILSKELSNYIIEEYKGYPLNSNISIEITSDYIMDNLEKDKIIDMIRANFGTEIGELIYFRKKNIIMDFILIIFGIISLVFYMFSNNIAILSELILVFSWVLIGESVYNLLFTGIINRVDIERKRKLTNCEIIFK